MFLIEVRLTDAGTLEVGRAVRMLGAAQNRMRASAIVTRTLMAGLSETNPRLICLIEAPSLDAAQRLVSMALLPAARIREITPLAGRL